MVSLKTIRLIFELSEIIFNYDELLAQTKILKTT